MVTRIADLLLGASGEVEDATIVIQRKQGKRWKKQKALPSRTVESGTAPLGMGLGRLGAGKYRLQVTVTSPFGEEQTWLAPFTIKP
jgi:hypothetical protein